MMLGKKLISSTLFAVATLSFFAISAKSATDATNYWDGNGDNNNWSNNDNWRSYWHDMDDAHITDGATITVDAAILAGVVTSDGETIFYYNDNCTLAVYYYIEVGTGSLTITGGETTTADVRINGSGEFKITGGKVTVTENMVLSGDTTSLSVSGGELVINNTITGNGAVSFTENGKLVLSDEFLANVVETEEPVAVITAMSIIFGEEKLSGTYSGDYLNSLLADYVIYSDDYTLDWSYDETNGTLSASVTYLPEPSMFGVLLGLGAIGLVSIRRRRKSV